MRAVSGWMGGALRAMRGGALMGCDFPGSGWGLKRGLRRGAGARGIQAGANATYQRLDVQRCAQRRQHAVSH